MTIPAEASVRSRQIRSAAVAVLVVGWLAAAIVYIVAAASDADASGDRIVNGQVFSTGDASSRELQQIARLGGTAAVITFRFNRWFMSLWSGRPLALTLAVLALIIAAACMHVASLLDE